MITLSSEDFAILTRAGFEARMAALKERLTPTLQSIGEALAPTLSERVGQPLYVHAARHARRRVNPPVDTWVALSPERRGYKMTAHFEVGLFASYLFTRVGVLYEADHRNTFAAALRPMAADLPDGLGIVTEHLVEAPPLYVGDGAVAAIDAAIERRSADVLVERRFPVEAVDGRDVVTLVHDSLPPLIAVYERWLTR